MAENSDGDQPNSAVSRDMKYGYEISIENWEEVIRFGEM